LEINATQTNNRKEADSRLRGKRNWPLIGGFVLVIIIAIFAVIGPEIAPQDPAEEHNISFIEGEWYVPPFDIGTPGYPLGSDRFGRDVLSRLLWGVRPTMIMVLVVAVVRLFLGVIIGLSAGWFSGKTGRFLNSLIQVALALPVLLVALGAIAIVGVELGIWAFIIGLSLTGWVDTALQVREQTRIVKKQVYVEAASAMGATNQQILSNHILKQIVPMLLMLFAFEISSTLMLTAGLGFLGYYIGGDVWVETDDFVARRISGSPELGQMLATSWLTLTKPWALVAVGTTVFLTVLGFNLIGEGLRLDLGFTKVPRRNSISEYRNKFGLWLDNNVWHPLVQFFRIKPLQIGFVIIGAFFLLSLGTLFLLDAASQTDAPKVLAMFNQNGASSTEETPMENTPSTTQTGTNEISLVTKYNPIISWEFFDEGGFTGGPVLSKDQDQIYLASGSGITYAFELDGQERWQLELSSGGVGTPVVNSEGEIYVADKEGGLNKITPHGKLVWHFQSPAGDRSHSGPAIGPNGNIFYTVGNTTQGFVQAVSPNGEGLWHTEAKTRLFFESPDPSPDENYIFLKEDIFNQENGEYLDLEYDVNIIRVFSGSNGGNYLLAGHSIIQWQAAADSIKTIDVYEWDSSHLSEIYTPTGVGVNKDGTSWQLYTTPGGKTLFVWVSEEDQALGTTEVNISGSTLVYMKEDLSALVCGGGSFKPSSTDCSVLTPDNEDPMWKLHLGNYGPVVGGIFLDDHYYVSTEDGHLFEIDENLEEITSTLDTVNSGTGSGILWSYQASNEILFISKNGPDGYFYLTTEDDKLHIIKPDGEIYNVIQLPAAPFHQMSDTGRSPALFIEPIIFPDGTIIEISDENTIYALNIDGEILWEHIFESAPAEYPIQDELGNLYFIDNDAAMNAYDKDGLKWRFQTEAADIPADGIAVDQEGNIYYVVTDYGKGYLQAVSSEGDNIWVLEAKTRDFYDELHISQDGKYLSLAEDLVSTDMGELIEYQNAGETDEFIFAANGQNFVRSLHTVSEWRPGPEGIEILGSGIVSEEDTTLRPPLGSSADSNGIIWLYYPETYTGGGIIVVWMSPEGEILGNHHFDRNFQTLVAMDMDRSILTECIWFDDTNSIDCSSYSPYSQEAVWSAILQDIPSFNGGYIDGNMMYVFGENDEIYLIDLGGPTSP
jgi:peptide/nickel transport system permease protein